MLNPTLLDRSRTPARAVVGDSKLAPTLSTANYKKRISEERRPAPDKKTTADARRDIAMKRGGTPDPDQGVRMFERIIKGNDLVPVNYLDRGVDCSRSVCRVRLMNTSRETVGFATGFMVARGVLLTNQHVLPTAAHARHALAEFGYEHDAQGGDRTPMVFAFDLKNPPIIRPDLDFCLVGVMGQSVDGAARRDDYGWLPLDGTPGKTRTNEYLTIIQHPAGERKQICVRENRLIKYASHTLWYQTDTVAGSSGSPVFNNSWQVVALHHSGVPETNARGQILTVDGAVYDPSSMEENVIAWKANEGVRVSSILAALREDHRRHPLARAVMASWPCAALPELRRGGHGGGPSVTVPVYIDRVAGRGLPGDEAADGGVDELTFDMTLEVSTRPVVGAISSFPSRDKDDLSDRKGYQENFLGSGALLVPKPRIAKAMAFNRALTWGTGGRKTELPYDRHTVVLSAERRLAIWTAVNIDDNRRYIQPGKDPRWIPDPRVNGLDVGDTFYKTDPGAAADGQKNRTSPFDRGHQVQQEDATWGASAKAAARASADTFYFPNAAPQIMTFNQGAKAWQGLEDYCIEVFAVKTGKACVFTGAVFDAPKAGGTPQSGTNALAINPKGARNKDPQFLGVRVPKAFYKVVVCSDGQRLRCAAFLMSQQFQLDRLKGTPIVDVEETLTTTQAKIFFVKVDDVEALTGLSFGTNVQKAQVATLEAVRIGRGTQVGTELRSLADLRL